jgi:hypothetical protein
MHEHSRFTAAWLTSPDLVHESYQKVTTKLPKNLADTTNR